MDTNPANEVVEKCWSCQRDDLAPSIMVDVADSGEPILCRDCWDQVPVHWRVMLGLLVRSQADGGYGIVELLEEAGEVYPFGALRESRN